MTNCGLLRIRYTDRYSAPPAWRAGTPRPHNMAAMPWRQALSRDWRTMPEEVWIYPLHSTGGAPLRPTRHGTAEQIKQELGVTLSLSGVMVDIDDLATHAAKQKQSHVTWYAAVESALEPLKAVSGYFSYRTMRGIRCGFIFAEAVPIQIGQYAQREIYRQISSMLAGIEQAEVDEKCLDLSRGQAAPLINKRGSPIHDDLPQLYIHHEDLPLDLIMQFAQAWKQRTVTSEAPKPTTNANSGQGAQPNTQQRSKPRVLIPYDIDDLDGSQRYDATFSAFWKLARWIHNEELRLRILDAFDDVLMDGRRKQKEGAEWAQRWIEDFEGRAENIPDSEFSADLKAPIVTVFNELAPIKRTFSRGDDYEFAEAILATMGDSPAPIWHGEGLRRYDASLGIWKMYHKHHLRRIAMSAEGAVLNKPKGAAPLAISNARIKAAIEMIASLTGAGEKSAFDFAPAGVVLGQQFVTVAHGALTVEPVSPTWYAIHRLDYIIDPLVVRYWMTAGDEGRPPKKPPVFTGDYLKASLHRAPDQDETLEQIQREIEAKITTIGEWLGLALLGLCTREATALVVHGSGSNGKSVLTSLIADLFGAERTAHLPPQQMSERFSRAQLFGAAVNVVSEMPEADLLASDTLKAVISGDTIEVEKKHQDPFSFTPRAAHIFAANTLPASRDRSWGLWRRLVPIEFHQKFTRENRDISLKDRLRAEYDLIVTWALDLAREYLERGGYAHEDMINNWRSEWREEVDSISAFIKAQCEPCTIEDGTEISAIWRAHRIWAEDVGQTGAAKMSLIQFSKSIKGMSNLERKRRGKARKTYINLRLTNENEPSAWSVK